MVALDFDWRRRCGLEPGERSDWNCRIVFDPAVDADFRRGRGRGLRSSGAHHPRGSLSIKDSRPNHGGFFHGDSGRKRARLRVRRLGERPVRLALGILPRTSARYAARRALRFHAGAATYDAATDDTRTEKSAG